MILKSKRGFSSFDAVTTIAAVVAVMIVTTPFVKKYVENKKIDHTEASVQALAEELAGASSQELLVNASKNKARDVASVNASDGTIGKDPWGNPYHYRILRNAYGQPTHILVYSGGPNSQLDTNAQLIKPDNEGKPSNYVTGDDVAYIKMFH